MGTRHNYSPGQTHDQKTALKQTDISGLKNVVPYGVPQPADLQNTV